MKQPMDFKRGDRVICIEGWPDPKRRLLEGVVYTISEVGQLSTHFRNTVRCKETSTQFWLNKRFVPYSKLAMAIYGD